MSTSLGPGARALLWGTAGVLVVQIVGGLLRAWDPTWGLFATIWLVLPALAALAARELVRAEQVTLAEVLGLVSPRPRHAFVALLAAPALMLASESICRFEARLAWDIGPWRPVRLLELPPAARVLLLAVSPAIGEELFFRGALLQRLRRAFPVWLCILFEGVLFGAAHVGTGCVSPAVLLGGVLTWITLRSRSLAPAILLHAVHNVLVLFATDLGVWLASL